MNWRRVNKAWKRYVWIRLLRSLRPMTEVTTIHHKRMKVDLRDEFIGPALYLNGEIDTHLQDVMRFMDLEGSICLDVGANVGLFTLAMSDLVGKTGKIYAFEPEDHNFEMLSHNLEANGAANVTAIKAAVGDTVGKCRIVLAESNLGDHQVQTRATDGGRVQDARMTTIDAVLRDEADGAVKLIKIDVQGFEYQVMKGMTDTLRRNPDLVTIIEVGPGRLRNAGSSATELLHLFADAGLRGWEFHDYRIAPVAEAWVYELFPGVREEDFILSQNPEMISKILTGYYGKPLPRENRSDSPL